MTSITDSLLVIGVSDTGKTHYGGQLLIRLRKGLGLLRLAVAPDSIKAFDEVLTCLNEGRSAPHTASNFYGKETLPLVDSIGNRIDVHWPDYAGEQIKNIRDDRLMPIEWRERLLKSRGWLFFIRPDVARNNEDIILRPVSEDVLARAATSKEASNESKVAAWSEQAANIELLQMLLYAKGVSSANPISTPYLAIILSCWDEIKLPKKKRRLPIDVLRETMPLFAEFVSSNWQEDAYSVFGVSSLSKALNDKVPDEDYLDNGPESFGYVVLPDGNQDDDLTLPVAKILERLI
jgi:hypothetical protein